MIEPAETPDAPHVEAPPPSEPAAAAIQAGIEAEIDAWFVAHMHGSIVSRSTDIYNHVRAAVDDLKTRLAKGTRP